MFNRIHKHLATIITVSRVFVALLFYSVMQFNATVSVVLLWVCFIFIEISDILDGMVARKLGIVSDLGKLFDPTCDISSHFLCLFALVQKGLVPGVVLVVFVLREIWILFLRGQLIKANVVLSAKISGKIKTLLYGIGIFLALLLFPSGPFASYLLEYRIFIDLVLYLASIMSIASGVQYMLLAKKIFHQQQNKHH